MQVDPLEVVEEMGLQKVRVSRGRITALCPLHDDRNPSFSMRALIRRLRTPGAERRLRGRSHPTVSEDDERHTLWRAVEATSALVTLVTAAMVTTATSTSRLEFLKLA